MRSLARFRPRRRVRRAKTGSPRSRFHGFPGSYPHAHAKTRTHPNLAPTLTLAAPTTQVLYVMKDTALHAPAKKLLEDIGYKGASWRHRAPDPARTAFSDYHAWKTRSPRPSGRGFSVRGGFTRASPRGDRTPRRKPRAVRRAPAGRPPARSARRRRRSRRDARRRALSPHVRPPHRIATVSGVVPSTWQFRDIRTERGRLIFSHTHALLLACVLPPSSHTLPPSSRAQLLPPRPSIRVSASSSPPPPTRRRRSTSRSSRETGGAALPRGAALRPRPRRDHHRRDGHRPGRRPLRALHAPREGRGDRPHARGGGRVVEGVHDRGDQGWCRRRRSVSAREAVDAHAVAHAVRKMIRAQAEASAKRSGGPDSA